MGRDFCLGLWSHSSLHREHSIPASPHLSSTFKFQHGFFCHYCSPSMHTCTRTRTHARTPRSLGYMPPRNPINTATVLGCLPRQAVCSLRAGTVSAVFTLVPPGAWHITVSHCYSLNMLMKNIYTLSYKFQPRKCNPKEIIKRSLIHNCSEE